MIPAFVVLLSLLTLGTLVFLLSLCWSAAVADERHEKLVREYKVRQAEQHKRLSI